MMSHQHNMSGPGPIKAQHEIFSDQFSKQAESKASYTKSGDFQGMPFYPTYHFQGYGKSMNPYSSPASRDGNENFRKAPGINSVDLKTADVSLPYQGFYGSPVLLNPPKPETSPPVNKENSLDQSEEHESSGIKDTKRFLNNLLDESGDPEKREKL